MLLWAWGRGWFSGRLFFRRLSDWAWGARNRSLTLAARFRAAGSVVGGGVWLWAAVPLRALAVTRGVLGVTKSGHSDVISLPFLNTRKWALEFGLSSIGESLADGNAMFHCQRIFGARTGAQAAREKLTSSMNKTIVDYNFIQPRTAAEKPAYGVTGVDNPMNALALSNFDDRTQVFALEKGLSADQDSGR